MDDFSTLFRYRLLHLFPSFLVNGPCSIFNEGSMESQLQCIEYCKSNTEIGSQATHKNMIYSPASEIISQSGRFLFSIVIKTTVRINTGVRSFAEYSFNGMNV